MLDCFAAQQQTRKLRRKNFDLFYLKLKFSSDLNDFTPSL